MSISREDDEHARMWEQARTAAKATLVSAEISVTNPDTVYVAPYSSYHHPYRAPDLTIALSQSYGRGGVLIHASRAVAEAMVRKLEQALAALPKAGE